MDLRETQTPSIGFEAHMASFAYIYSQLLRSFLMIASLLCCLITFACNDCSYSWLKYVEVGQRCLYCDYVTGWTTGTRFTARTSVFFFATSRIVLGTKRPGRVAGHSFQSSVNNAWNYTSRPSYIFVAWCVTEGKDNCGLQWTVYDTLKRQDKNFLSNRQVLHLPISPSRTVTVVWIYINS